MNRQIFLLVTAQLKEFIREPEVLFWSILFPVALAGILGIAFTSKSSVNAEIPVVASEAEIDEYLRHPLFQSQGQRFNFFKLEREEEALDLLRNNKVDLYLTISDQEEVVFHYDEANNQAQIIHLTLENQLLTSESDQKFSIETITSAGNRYIDFLIPGLIALGIMNSCMWGIGYNLIDYRVKRLLRLIVATPMKKSSFMLGQFVTRVILTAIDSLLVFLFAYLVFGVTMSGNILLLAILFISGVFSFSGIAILTSSRARRSQVGNGLINAVVLPLTILSGIFFSYENFPDWAILIIERLPLTILSNGLRSIFFNEAELLPILGQSAELIIFGALTLVFGLRIYRWY